MGCYVRLSLDIKLKVDTPKEVIDILRRVKRVELPDHKFFKNSDWSNVLEKPTLRKLRENKGYSLNLLSEFKECWGIERRLIDWLNPYINHLPGEVLGWREDDYNDRVLLIKK